jgi:hypothetical protein
VEVSHGKQEEVSESCIISGVKCTTETHKLTEMKYFEISGSTVHIYYSVQSNGFTHI